MDIPFQDYGDKQTVKRSLTQVSTDGSQVMPASTQPHELSQTESNTGMIESTETTPLNTSASPPSPEKRRPGYTHTQKTPTITLRNPVHNTQANALLSISSYECKISEFDIPTVAQYGLSGRELCYNTKLFDTNHYTRQPQPSGTTDQKPNAS
jgi:hypothetical protein